MDDLYKEIILEHYQNPLHRGKIEGGSAGWRRGSEVNMTCGDSLRIFVKIKEGIIMDAKFEGGGCAISMAAVDMFLDDVIGKKLIEVQKMSGARIEEMMGVELTPARKKCAYLGLEVMKKMV